MSTLDYISYCKIPNLDQGEAIITGTAMNIPLLVKIDKEKVIRPNSDDVKLTMLWTLKEKQSKNSFKQGKDNEQQL